MCALSLIPKQGKFEREEKMGGRQKEGRDTGRKGEREGEREGGKEGERGEQGKTKRGEREKREVPPKYEFHVYQYGKYDVHQ